MNRHDSEPILADHNEIIRLRYEKVDRIRESGLNPYVTKWEPTHLSAEIRSQQEALIADKTTVHSAGRIMTIRNMGKANFFNLQDSSGIIQVYLKKGELSDEQYEVFKELADMGDLVGVSGYTFITKTGELSIHAASFEILTKSVRPLPEKYHGLTDKETRYRQRYVDLIVNDEVRDTFIARSRMVAELRNYLTGRGYLEVETPMMHPVVGGATARPFITHHNALDMPLFLRVAPELYLKRLMVGGLERTFEINRNFRNEGLSVRHNPEFTMLELYTAYWNYEKTMALTEESIRHIALEVFKSTEFDFGTHKFSVGTPFPRVTYIDAIQRYIPALSDAGFSWSDPVETTIQKLDGKIHASAATHTHAILIELFEKHVEPQLMQPIFITEFPKASSPLAKSKDNDPKVAERFELYMCGMEIANGYSELNDPKEQYELFKEQVAAKASGDDEANDMDEDYIRALEYGMPPASGLGVGIDRLTMLLTNSASIRDVILFPHMKPE